MEQQSENSERALRYPEVETWLTEILLEIQDQWIKNQHTPITTNDVRNIVARKINAPILTVIAMEVFLDLGPVNITQWEKITTPNPKNILSLTETVTHIIDGAFKRKAELWKKGIPYVIRKLTEEIIVSVDMKPGNACDYIDPNDTNGNARRRDMILQVEMDVKHSLRTFYDPLQEQLRRRRGYYDD